MTLVCVQLSEGAFGTYCGPLKSRLCLWHVAQVEVCTSARAKHAIARFFPALAGKSFTLKQNIFQRWVKWLNFWGLVLCTCKMYTGEKILKIKPSGFHSWFEFWFIMSVTHHLWTCLLFWGQLEWSHLYSREPLSFFLTNEFFRWKLQSIWALNTKIQVIYYQGYGKKEVIF